MPKKADPIGSRSVILCSMSPCFSGDLPRLVSTSPLPPVTNSGALAAAPETEAVKRHLFDSPAAAVAAKPTAIVKPRKEGSELSGWYIY